VFFAPWSKQDKMLPSVGAGLLVFGACLAVELGSGQKNVPPSFAGACMMVTLPAEIWLVEVLARPIIHPMAITDPPAHESKIVQILKHVFLGIPLVGLFFGSYGLTFWALMLFRRDNVLGAYLALSGVPLILFVVGVVGYFFRRTFPQDHACVYIGCRSSTSEWVRTVDLIKRQHFYNLQRLTLERPLTGVATANVKCATCGDEFSTGVRSRAAVFARGLKPSILTCAILLIAFFLNGYATSGISAAFSMLMLFYSSVMCILRLFDNETSYVFDRAVTLRHEREKPKDHMIFQDTKGDPE
jgi:hypothetical protein